MDYAIPVLGEDMAAMTVSMNVQGTRYAATVETNGHRVEMVTDENVEKHIMSLIKNGRNPPTFTSPGATSAVPAA
jgi:eukaryotic translation initiation factor 2C